MNTLSQIGISLLIAAALVGCGKSSSSGTSTSLTNLSGALTVPTAGSSRRMIKKEWKLFADKDSRTGSRAGCETVNATTRMKGIALMPKMMLCMFGAMEDAGLISKPATGFNYYQFAKGGNTFLVRYGTYSGNLLVSGCQGGSQVMELGLASANSQYTLTATNNFTPPGGTSAQVGQLVVTADSSLNYVSGTATMYGTFIGGFSVTKGTPNIVTEYFVPPARTKKTTMYSQFDSNEGTSNVSLVNGGSTTNLVNSWENAAGFACITPASSGTYYTAVNAYDLTSIQAPTSAPSFINAWDCTAAGGSFTTVTASGDTIQAAVAACLSTNGSGAPIADTDCSSTGACT